MSPLEIKIMLHFYYSPKGTDYPDGSSSAYADAIAVFRSHGILRLSENSHIYANPEALEVYVEALMAVPLPTQKWVIE
jgi:hypothetical protein